MDILQREKEKMLIVCKIFQRQNMLDGFGHVSLRVSGERILSTPKMPPGKVSMRDFILLNSEGKKVEGTADPNGETPMHSAIYRRRPDVNCILHYHAEEIIAASVVAQKIKVLANCGVFFHRGIPLYDSPLLITTDDLADKVAKTLQDYNAILLRGHGATVVSDDLDELVRLGINLVKSARIQIMASAMGTPKEHTESESKTILEKELGMGAIRRFIDFYISETVD